MSDEYLLLFHKEDLIEILSSNDNTKHYSININFIELYEHNDELARDILNDPESNIEAWNNAAIRTQMSLLKELDKKVEIKSNVHCRIFHLAHLAWKSAFPGCKDEGSFLQISGTVMRITAAKLLEYQRSYVCVKCKMSTLVKADYSRKYMIKQPTQCKNPEGCSGTNLISFGDIDSDNCKDYQEIKIQEQVKKLGLGSVPSTMWVTLEDDLVDCCQPGDDVTICGILKKRYGEFSLGKRTEIDLVFKANHIQVDSHNSYIPISNPESENIFQNFWEQYKDNPLEGRDLILKSICPEIYGLFPVKLAMATVLAGGCSIEDTTSTGVRTRSEAHLLLVGDPGTGKSQLLRFASKVVPRAVLTTGIGSTAAGLTVTAKMEQGEWHLEAGALVMSDGGICCIDEFNSMKEHDRTTIHEAMEQQTISVAKASMVCKLNTRCAILAACNPKGNIDPTQTMSMNIALPSPLLSRFDLVMLLRDTVNQEWDELVIDYILNGGLISNLTSSSIWPVKNLQPYFKRIKKLQPKLTEDAELILSTYYNIQRRLDSRNKARTTVRLLESLVRISQGHARLMNHEKVQIVDSVYAIFLVDISMDIESSVLNLKTSVNSVFPEKPNVAYKNLLESILNKLQLENLLEKELQLINLTKEQQLQSRFFENQGKKLGNNENNASSVNISLRDEIFDPRNTKSANINNNAAVRNIVTEDVNKSCTIRSDAEKRKSVKTSNRTADVDLDDFDLILNETNKRKSISGNSEPGGSGRKRKKVNENINVPEENKKNKESKANKSSMFESVFEENTSVQNSVRPNVFTISVKNSQNENRSSKSNEIKGDQLRKQKVDNESSRFDQLSKIPSPSKLSSKNEHKPFNSSKTKARIPEMNEEDGMNHVLNILNKVSEEDVTENLENPEKTNDLNNSESGCVKDISDANDTGSKPKKTPPGRVNSLSRFKFVSKEARVDNKQHAVTDSFKLSVVDNKNIVTKVTKPDISDSLTDVVNASTKSLDQTPKEKSGKVFVLENDQIQQNRIYKKDKIETKNKNNISNLSQTKSSNIFDSFDPICLDDILESDCGPSKKKTSKLVSKKSCNRIPFKKGSSGGGGIIKNEWDMLKFMPGVNDGFNIDLDVDWDSLGAENGGSSFANSGSKGSTVKTGTNIFESFDDVDFNI